MKHPNSKYVCDLIEAQRLIDAAILYLAQDASENPTSAICEQLIRTRDELQAVALAALVGLTK